MATKPRCDYNVYEQQCPARQVLERLADKWALLILDRLEAGPARFNVLKRDIRQITQKVLAQNLRKLERDGLIGREVFATVPVGVEYRLTTLGSTLTETVAALAHWAEQNMDAVFAAQKAFDERATAEVAVNGVNGGQMAVRVHRAR